MSFKGQFFAIYTDGTSALAASERELSELRGDRVEAVSGHAEALEGDEELRRIVETGPSPKEVVFAPGLLSRNELEGLRDQILADLARFDAPARL